MNNTERQIIDFLNHPGYVPVKAKSLSKKLGFNKKTRAKFDSVLTKLISDGYVRENRHGFLSPAQPDGVVAGIVKRIASGAGFFIPHEPISKAENSDESDLFVSPRDMRDAQSGDEVFVEVLKRKGRGGRQCARVVEIIERATHTFVGTYFEVDGHGYVDVDGDVFRDPISVGDPGAKGAKPDQKVVIEMIRFPTHQYMGEAVLTEVLGKQGDRGVDVLTIIHEFGLPHEFPEEVLQEARVVADQFDEFDLGDRLDWTKEPTVTIDPKDARDFDDAISLSKNERGHWRLGVHIADVSHFVELGSALDVEAKRRSTSVYLPGQVIPMLPEVISNGLASLQEGKIRFTKSVFIELTPDGIPVDVEFANSAIKVNKRLTYEKAYEAIMSPDEQFKGITKKIHRLLRQMYELAMTLRGRRLSGGALELDLPEVELKYSKAGKIVGATQSTHDESHQIIEEFMLAANRAVAENLSDRHVAFVRRIHGEPDFLKLQSFADFVQAMGYKLKQFQSRAALQSLLKQVRGEPIERAVNYALLRSMKPAEYSTKNRGHYALAFEQYCHFTSPIRRYPDLTIHRTIGEIVEKRKKTDKSKAENLEITTLAKHCSKYERRAEKAERELTQIKLLQLMESRIGETMTAIINGVERFGFFCHGTELPVDGMVHVESLTDDHYYHERSTYSLTGRRSGRVYQLGGIVQVQVVQVDVGRRKLDFVVVDEKSGKSSRKPDSSKTRQRDQGRRRKRRK